MTEQDSRAVCVVDDDDAVRDSLKVLLESHGMRVRDFASADDFLSEYSSDDCRCLVLDLHMPVMSGLDLLEVLRERKIEVPAVMVTGNADPKLVSRLGKARLAALLVKPVTDDELIDRIARACTSSLH